MTTENTVTTDGQTPAQQNPNLPPATQTPAPAPANQIPIERLNEEIAKRQDLENQLAQLREQQLRMMAQQPVYQPPAYQTPQTQETNEDFDQVFTVDPRRAIDSRLAQERTRILKESEETARRTFHTEANKLMARQRYPELNNPNSEFFKRVSFFMSTHPERYNDPEGILDACARVRMDMPQENPTQQQMSQRIVQQVASTASQVAGSSTAPSTEEPRLDPEAQLLAQKLNIDPKKFALRQKNLQDGKGEYAPLPNKQGKARFVGGQK
jgi:hypothetical protein